MHVGDLLYIKRHLPLSSFYESQHHRRSRLSASERTQPSIPTAQARLQGLQADPRILAYAPLHIKARSRLQPDKPSEDLP